MKLEIITPEQVYYSGEVTSVTLPGVMGTFTVLENHAPIISILGKGNVTYKVENTEEALPISGGFMEGHENVITVSVEEIKND